MLVCWCALRVCVCVFLCSYALCMWCESNRIRCIFCVREQVQGTVVLTCMCNPHKLHKGLFTFIYFKLKLIVTVLTCLAVIQKICIICMKNSIVIALSLFSLFTSPIITIHRSHQCCHCHSVPSQLGCCPHHWYGHCLLQYSLCKHFILHVLSYLQ